MRRPGRAIDDVRPAGGVASWLGWCRPRRQRRGAVGATAACSDPATTAKIKGAAQAAYTAVRTAEASGASADLSLAVSAVGALSAVIPAAK